MEHRPCQMDLRKQGFFFTRKVATRGVNLNLRVDAIGYFRMVKTIRSIGRHPGSMGQRWAGGEWIRTIHGAPLKRCQAKIVCLVLGSSDPNYRTKQMASGDAQDPWVTGQQIGTQSLKRLIVTSREENVRRWDINCRMIREIVTERIWQMSLIVQWRKPKKITQDTGSSKPPYA